MAFFHKKEEFLKSARDVSYGELFDTLQEMQKILTKKWYEEVVYSEALARYLISYEGKVHDNRLLDDEESAMKTWAVVFKNNRTLKREMFAKVSGCNRKDFVDFYFEFKDKYSKENSGHTILQ